MTDKAITPVRPMPVAPTVDFTPEQKELIKRTIAVGCTDDELELFIQVCRVKRLDPFSRQIYAIKRWDSKQRREVMAIQVGIDGYRLTAERTGLYRGQGPIEWCDRDGNWTDVWLHDEPPAAARCSVYREGLEGPITRVAKFSSYCAYGKEGQPVANWRTMPEVMIGKCAEALAIRTAFPAELGGTTTPEEMEHDVDSVIHYDPTVITEEPTASQRLPPAEGALTKRDIDLLKQEVEQEAIRLGVNAAEGWKTVGGHIRETYDIHKYSQLTREQYREAVDQISTLLATLVDPDDNLSGPAWQDESVGGQGHE